MNNSTTDWASILAAGIAGVAAILAAKTGRNTTDLLDDIRELRKTIIKHLENHPN